MPNEHHYYTYIVASLSGTLYIGMTNGLRKRIWQHKNHKFEGFTSQYDVDRLVFWERYQFVRGAIAREKQLKGWTRAKKISLIEKQNPQWKDLSKDWYRDACDLRVVEPQRFAEE